MAERDCTCRVCVFARRVDSALQGHDIVTMRKVVSELATLLANVEDERNWAHAVIDGSWPDANSVIARARRACGRSLPVESDADKRAGRTH